MTPVLAIVGNSALLCLNGAAHERAIRDGTDCAPTLLQLLEEQQAPRGPLHLLYHPIDLQVATAACPNVSRAKLRDYFREEYRELSNPDAPWGATRPQSQPDGKFVTLVHYEGRTRFRGLITALEEKGWRVRVALPPAAALVNRPEPKDELVLLTAGDTYLLYHVNELDVPTIRLVRSFETLRELLGDALASRKNPPASVALVTIVPPDPELMECLGQHGLKERCRIVSWADFAANTPFNVDDPANLALQPFRWRQGHAVYGLAAAFAVGAFLLGYQQAAQLLRARELSGANAARRQRLERDVTALTRTEEKFHGLEALVAAVPLTSPRPGLLLEFVTQGLPPVLQLQVFRYQSGQFTLEGVAFDGVGQEKGPFSQFVEALANGSRPWTVRPQKPPTSSVWTVASVVTS